MNVLPWHIPIVLALLLAACGNPPGPVNPEPVDPAPIDPGATDSNGGTPPALPNEYSFNIGGREFAPLPGVPPDFLARVEASIADRQARFVGSPPSAYSLVQFHEPLHRTKREQLESRGVIILDRITYHTWIAAADLISARSLLSDADVRWAEVYPDDVKRSPTSRRPEPFDWQIREDGRAAYAVLFHSDVQVDEVELLPRAMQGLELSQFDPETFPLLNTAVVVIDPVDLDELASIQAVRWIEPAQPPAINFNLDQAQPTSNVDVVQASPYELTGRGITVGVWEAKSVIDPAPLDLEGRVIVEAGQNSACDDHPVHVAGTLGGSGVHIGKARGMAPMVEMTSWDSLNDIAEMTKAAISPEGSGDPRRIVASNHSYGAPIGWHDDGIGFDDNQSIFGEYNIQTRGFDVVVANHSLIISVAAGNDRDDIPADARNDKAPADCRQGGLNIDADCISPKGSAKNVITVGATNGSGAIAGFSSFGPADDGRIKPDLMAHGINTRSLACDCAADSNGDGLPDNVCATEESVGKSGTSMAAPVVTGVVALMLEQADHLSISLTPAAMRALLIQTARDVSGIGQSKGGPDFATGWGIVDARAAADLLRHSPGSRLLQKTLDDVGTENAWKQTFDVPAGLAELRITLAWADPASNPSDKSKKPGLVNDLDLRLIGPDNMEFKPWILNHNDPAAAAVRNGGDDSINNVEQVSVLQPQQGTWTVQVSAKKGSLVFSAQRFALAASVALDS